MISVIIPVYNGEKYIRRCIHTLLQQTYINLELLFIDDGSSDHTGEIIKNYSLADGRIKYFYKKNGGVSSARNYGIKVASGDYVSFIDVDDELKNDFYEKVSTTFDNNMIDVVITNYLYVFPDRTEIGINKIHIDNYLYSLLNNNEIMGYVFNKVYRRELVKSHFFDDSIKIYEDLLYNVTLSHKINSYYYLTEPYYLYYQNSDSAMHSTFFKDCSRFYAEIKIIDKLICYNASEKIITDRMYFYVWDFQKTNLNHDIQKEPELDNKFKEYLTLLKKKELSIKRRATLFLITKQPKLYFSLLGENK